MLGTSLSESVLAITSSRLRELHRKKYQEGGEIMKLEEAIKILRQHNVTGASVLRITRGQALEKDLLSQVLDSCEQLISEKAEYKRLLKAAVEDFKKINSDILTCKYCKWYSAENDECTVMSPCKDCTDRCMGCHSTCGDYAEYKRALEDNRA